MKICLIGPGIMPIPPPAWGAVEILIWDYYTALTQLGHHVTIINTPNTPDIIQQVNEIKPEFVHLHYDVFYHILDKLDCPNIAITSHYPYIDQHHKHASDGYTPIYRFLIQNHRYYNFALAEKDITALLRDGANPQFIRKIKNGINHTLFHFTPEAPDITKTIYLGKIVSRKNQSQYTSIPNLFFVGAIDDPSFKPTTGQYLNEWTRTEIHQKLTEFTNLLLMSSGECDPLVVKEALTAGLGVVINRGSSENIHTDSSPLGDHKLPEFITIVPDDRMHDIPYITECIQRNADICRQPGTRQRIRQYAKHHFSITRECRKYIDIITSINTIATIVTAYFRLGDGRSKASHQQYLRWMHNMLTIRNPMIIFCDEQSSDMLLNIRREYGLTHWTRIIVTHFTEFYTYQFIDVFRRQHAYDPERAIGHSPELYMIWNEKSHFLKRAINANPFHTNYFVWTDIGCFRKTNKLYLNWPNPERIRQLQTDTRDKVLLLEVERFSPEELACHHLPIQAGDIPLPDYFRRNRIGAPIFGGSRQALLAWHTQYYKMLRYFIHSGEFPPESGEFPPESGEFPPETGRFIGKDQSIMNCTYLIHRHLCHLVPTQQVNILHGNNDPWFYLQDYYN